MNKPYVLITVFFVAHLIHHIITALLVPLLPFLRSELSINYTQTGLLVSAFSVMYGICQIPAGWLSDYLGRPFLVMIGISGVALCGLFVGISQTYTTLIIFFALMGILGGAYHPASVSLISKGVRAKERGRALGIHMIGGSLSHFLAPLLVGFFAINYSWRVPYVGLSLPTMVFGIFLYLFTKDLEKNKHSTSSISHEKERPTLSYILRLAPFIVLSSVGGAASFSMLPFVPLFLVDHFGIRREIAASMISLFYFSGLWGSFIGGYLADRFKVINITIMACFLLGINIFLITLSAHGWIIGLLLLLIGMVHYIRVVTSETHILNQTTDKNRSTIIGLYYFSTVESGGILTPVIGFLVDNYGFANTFKIVAILVLLITIIFFVVHKNMIEKYSSNNLNSTVEQIY